MNIMIHLVALWTSLYSNHAVLRTAVGFVHIGGLVGGGGCAIAADRMTLLAGREDRPTRVLQLTSLRTTHRVVLAGLAAVIVSGVLLFAADVDTFLYSKVFWLKMGLMVLLLFNGCVLVRAERRAEQGDEDAWRWLTWTSTISLALWFLTTLAGTGLLNV
jgi:hypothetical protein